MKTTSLLALLGLPLGAMAASAETITVEFQWIRQNATMRALGANDMSPDGRYVVGEYDLNGNPFADDMYLWDSVANTFTLLGVEINSAVAVSDDGSVVLGSFFDPNFGDAEAACRWTAGGGWQSLGALPNAGMCPSVSNGYELSADGSIAVGLSWDGCSGRGFRWTQATGMQELQSLANGSNRASVVSADGSLIAGFAQGLFNRTPTIWDGDTLTGELLSPPYDGSAQGEVNGMNESGTILLGTQYMNGADGSFDAVKWVNGGAPEIIGGGSLSGFWGGNAMDVADNGTIVGFDIRQGNRRAWIQPDGAGALVLLSDWATQHGAVIPSGVTLEVAQAISNDGRYIIGHGFGTGAWRLVVTRTGCPGDADGDGVVDFNDLNIVLGNYNMTGSGLSGDFDGDGDVDFADLNVVIDAYDQSC